MDLQRIQYRKNEAQEFRALTERLVGESGLDIELPYESPGVQHLMKYFNVLVGILVLLTIGLVAFVFYLNGGKSENFMITLSNEEMLVFFPLVLVWMFGMFFAKALYTRRHPRTLAGCRRSAGGTSRKRERLRQTRAAAC